jgi:hypothetical protein
MGECLLYSLICTFKIMFSLAHSFAKSVISEIYLLTSYTAESFTVTDITVLNEAVMTYSVST